MATRVGYVATESTGDTLTTTNFNKLPNGLIGYAKVTADQTGITTETDLTSLTVAPTLGSSRIIMVLAQINALGTDAGDYATLRIYEAGSVVSARSIQVGTHSQGLNAMSLSTPSSGSTTYKLTLDRLSGSGSLSLKASATNPGILAVVEFGPSF